MKAYLWGTVGDRDHPYDCFYFTVDRARAGPAEFLSGFRGYLQSDAYICYEQIALSSEEILKVGCWAHARRKFEELHFAGPSVWTHTALGYFGRLYDIEDRARELADQQRYEVRQQEASPIVTSFTSGCWNMYEQELPKSKLRSAIGYMVNRWDAFERYLEHGAIPIDNNRTEASLKYAILGRKAWLFFGNEDGGEAAATLFTLTKSCNRHRVDPYAYLCDVYRRLPSIRESELESLLPDRWIQEHPEHRIQQRVAEAAQRAERKRLRRAGAGKDFVVSELQMSCEPGKMSEMLKLMSERLLRHPAQLPSSEAAHVALFFATAAWNESVGLSGARDGYRQVWETIEADNPALWNELKRGNANQLIDELIRYKRSHYADDRRGSCCAGSSTARSAWSGCRRQPLESTHNGKRGCMAWCEPVIGKERFAFCSRRGACHGSGQRNECSGSRSNSDLIDRRADQLQITSDPPLVDYHQLQRRLGAAVATLTLCLRQCLADLSSRMPKRPGDLPNAHAIAMSTTYPAVILHLQHP